MLDKSISKTAANMHKKNVGNFGEQAAANYLKKLGYTILERNFYGKGYEIDIIAADKQNNLHFVEVKTRKNENFGYAYESVTKQKLSRIKRGAAVYVKYHNCDCELHFDIAEVYGSIGFFGFNVSKINLIRDVVG